MIVNENSFCSVSVRITHFGNCKLVRPDLIKVFSENWEAFHRILWKLLEHDSKCLFKFSLSVFCKHRELTYCSISSFVPIYFLPGLLWWLKMVKESMCNAGDLGSIPGLGRSPGGGHGNPLQYSCLENPHGQRAWWVTVHGVVKSQTQLSG